MSVALTRTQIDRLGDRLKKGNFSDADLQQLDAYRRTFAEAYETVIRVLRNDLTLEPTGRPAKSTTSISEKLRREHIRLTQIQDIAGCRLVVNDIAEQDRLIVALTRAFENAEVVDRRDRPSHGYRAVHVVVTASGKLVEVQIRTSLQHLWAELSEGLSDVFDKAIKYGGGDEGMQSVLERVSSHVATAESYERESNAQEEVDARRREIAEALRSLTDLLGKRLGKGSET